MHSILVVDDEKSIRTMLLDFLEERYRVATVENGEVALDWLEKNPCDLVISDINMPGIKGPELLYRIKQRWPHIITVLITAYNINDYIRMAKTYDICNIIPKTSPFNFDELQTLLHGLLTKEIFGLERYLRARHTILTTAVITSSQQSREVREEITDLFQKRFGMVGEMRLTIDEIVTNAIYHAPRLADNRQKYQEFTEVELLPDEYVHLTAGFDDEKYGVSILDGQGSLRRETVLYKIDRHIHEEGIMDDSGRGIHMSRLFADRMIINIQANFKTEVILMNYFSPTYRGFKPLYINEI
ncbi:MAG: response regulator [Chitinivibrionales bacterium]|nr:response regulator [Chitinivibrionales bacterium]